MGKRIEHRSETTVYKWDEVTPTCDRCGKDLPRLNDPTDLREVPLFGGFALTRIEIEEGRDGERIQAPRPRHDLSLLHQYCEACAVAIFTRGYSKIGPVHLLDAGRYYARIADDDIPMIFRADTAGAVREVEPTETT